MAASGLAHGRKQRQRSADIVEVIFLRVGDGLADQAGGGEMHHGDDAMPPEDLGQRRLVRQLGCNERAVDKPAVAGREIVVTDRADNRPRPAPGSHASQYSPRRR